MDVYLLTGSNLGERHVNLELAQQRIAAEAGAVLTASAVYETEPWGVHDQPWFLNQVLRISTAHQPQQLLAILKKVEKDISGEKQRHWGERLLDIDILFYGNEIIEEDNLNVPHPQIINRNFTLIPLAEVAPEIVHPLLHKKIKDILKETKDTLKVKKWRYREA